MTKHTQIPLKIHRSRAAICDKVIKMQTASITKCTFFKFFLLFIILSMSLMVWTGILSVLSKLSLIISIDWSSFCFLLFHHKVSFFVRQEEEREFFWRFTFKNSFDRFYWQPKWPEKTNLLKLYQIFFRIEPSAALWEFCRIKHHRIEQL